MTSRLAFLALLLLPALAEAQLGFSPGAKGINNPPRFTPRRGGLSEFSGPVAILGAGTTGLAKAGTYDGVTANLHIVSASAGSTTSGQPVFILQGHSTTSGLDPAIVLRRARDEGIGTTGNVNSGDLLGILAITGYGGSTAGWRNPQPLAGTNEGGFALEVRTTENWSGTSFGGDARFYTVKTGANTLTERLRMDGSGTTTAWQDVTDVPVFCAASVATNDDPTFCIYEGRQTVTGNQTVNVLSIATTNGTSSMINATIVCRCQTGSSACTSGHTRGDVRTALYRTASGTATEIEEQAVHAGIFDGTEDTATTFDISASGVNVLIRASGVANENLVCHATAEVQKDVGT